MCIRDSTCAHARACGVSASTHVPAARASVRDRPRLQAKQPADRFAQTEGAALEPRRPSTSNPWALSGSVLQHAASCS
eukprot:7777168-Alexandrium_andersonii.AAC.1